MRRLITALSFAVALSAGPVAHAAPQQQIPVSARPELIVLMNADTTYSAPTSNTNTGQPPWEMGHIIKVFDNLGTAGGSNITVSGKCGAGTSTISTNYGSVTLTWTGACFQ